MTLKNRFQLIATFLYISPLSLWQAQYLKCFGLC